MKLLVIGHGKHGKDTACAYLKKAYGLNFISSSMYMAEKVVRKYLAEKGITYDTAEDCYADRANHRDYWYTAISEFNGDDKAKLGKAIFSEFDVYCGLRNPDEFEAIKKMNLFDTCFWIDRSEHEQAEPITSFGLTKEDADYIIDNNGDLNNLELNLADAMSRKFGFCMG